MNCFPIATPSLPRKRHMRRTIAAACTAALAALVSISSPAFAGTIRDDQWYLSSLQVPQAQQISTGKAITVAVIDTGVDNTHPDLTGQTVHGHCFGAAKFLRPTDDPYGHGTEMAGIIAARGGDANHALGIAPHAKIMPLCVSLDHASAGAVTRSLTPAIRYAADHGAKVINLSIGGDGGGAMDEDVAALNASVRYALDHDVVLVAASGNQSRQQHIGLPADIPGILVVTGTTRSGQPWSGSVQGKEAALAAPATSITTPVSSNAQDGAGEKQYSTGNGTSASSAIVAGVAALVRARYPDLDAANVINRLIRTADHRGSAGRNPQYGYGIVDPVRALTAHVPHVDANPLGEPAAASTSASPTPEAVGSHATAPTSNSTIATILILAAVLLIAVIVIVVLLRHRSRRVSDAW